MWRYKATVNNLKFHNQSFYPSKLHMQTVQTQEPSDQSLH